MPLSGSLSGIGLSYNPAMDKAVVGPAIGKLPSSLAILTCGEHAMLASWIQQASFDPLILTVAIKSGRPMLVTVATAKSFALSLLAEDSNALMTVFAKGEDGALAKVAHAPSPSGHPILKDALAWLECRVRQTVPTGDHVLVVAEVIGGAIQREGKPRVHLRRNGFSY